MAKKNERKKQYGFLISPELAAGLKALKERDGITESEAIRRALTEHLKSKGVMKPDTARKRAR